MRCIVLLALALSTSCSSACGPLPQGTAGPAADALARDIETWIDIGAWQRTGAVRWDFRGDRRWVWDRARDFVWVQQDDLQVWLDLRDRSGVATEGGVTLAGDDERQALADAWAWFCNDSFWLNPLAKLFDAGTSREVVTVDGARALKVFYGAGGVTPGDTYVWLLDGARPKAVRMWVGALPVKGIEFSWDGWQTLATGAKVATKHGAGPADVALGDVAGAATLAALEPGAADRFAALVQRR